MKTGNFAIFAWAMGMLGIGLFDRVHAAGTEPSTIPSVPVGVMSAYPSVVQTGTKPTLTWNILYPSKVSDLVTIRPPGTLIPNQTIYVAVQMVGTTVTSCDPTKATQVPTEARMSVNNGNYFQLFYGTQTNVNPADYLYIKKIDAGTTLDFGGRYVLNGNWSQFFTTKSANMQVVAMVNGQTPPTTLPLYQSSRLAAYLKPYLDASGKVNIGPLSVLVMMELGQNNRNNQCFDLQDQLLLVSFSVQHPNNGHGNNLDGVDSSNPGQGQGGPNGSVDPSAGVDDESR